MLELTSNLMDFVIVRVIRGENFPSKEGELRLKVTWGEDESIVETVCCSENAVINLEVAFLISEFDERITNMENLSLFCTHVSLTDGTQLDYNPIDLSFCEKSKSNGKWYKCVSSGSSSMKEPSLFISIFGESNEETNSKVDLAINQRDELKLKLTQATTDVVKEKQLKPVLVNDEYFLIQDQSDTSEQVFFNMSVTISFAENLLYLFPSKSLWPSENIPFEFRFSLFGNPIRFQTFNCSRNLTEIGERATAKLKGSPKSVLNFLKQSMQTLSIMLFCEDIPIAEAIIPIRERIEHCQLEHRILEKLHLEPINISGIFPMCSLLEMELNALKESFTTPQVGVVVTLSEAEPKSTRQPTNQTYTALSPSVQSSIVSSETVKTCSEKVMFSSKKNRRSQEKSRETKDSLIYAAALELEVWKEEQKLLEKEKQERARSSYMELFNSEYRRQAAIKEAAFQRRVHGVEELEKQLENAIHNTRQTELELQQEKELLSKQRTQLERQKSVVASEVERVTQTLTTKHKFELEAERKRHTDIVTDLRRKLKIQQHKSSDDCKRISELEEELNSLKQAKK